jgi:hypothetical protein
MAAIDGKRILIKGPVTFRTGGYYFGRNVACRAMLSPALGDKPHENARFVVCRPDLWFCTVFQNGYVSRLNHDPAPIEKIPIDTSAFEWRRQRTSRLWLTSPVAHSGYYPPGDPFVLRGRYVGELDDIVVEEKGYVYFIMAAALDRVRIGWTTDPNRRPGELVRSSPVLLEYVALLPGTQDDEAWLQYRFRHLNTHDDWFVYNDELRAYIEWAKENWRKPGENPLLGSRRKTPVGSQGLEW